MFTDRVIVQLKAGRGGNGVIAWRREKYIPKGGPCGGDGGKGGSITLVADAQIPSLESFRNRRILKAEDGGQGGASNRRGKNGKNLLLKVPLGTLVKDAKSGTLLHDFTEDREELEICRGGRGGKGNTQFKSPTNRAPNICTPGKLGQIQEVELELKLIADVGLVGFPNAGKSTFMEAVTDLPVKTAPYPFTTLYPHLSYVVSEGGERLLIADIPGIIEGASNNRGLGLEFLRHIERTKVLLFIIDASGIDGRDPCEDYAVLRKELGAYDPALLKKPFVVALNKVDAPEAEENLTRFRQRDPLPFCEISAFTGHGLDKVLALLKRKLSK